jgi:fructose 1,6-bisphosphatase
MGGCFCPLCEGWSGAYHQNRHDPRLTVGEIGGKLLLLKGPPQVIDLGFELFEGMTTQENA